MGWFSQVTDFLASPAFRIGAGVAGLASGAGAFGDMGDWGTALQGVAGAANLASGAASTFGPNRSAFDRATGALQLGLGGYNVGQAAGAVGSFGDVWDQISGSGGSSALPNADTSGQGYLGYDQGVTREALPAFPDQAQPDMFSTAAGMPGYTPPSLASSATPGGETYTSTMEDPPYAAAPRPGQGTPTALSAPSPAPAPTPAPTPPPNPDVQQLPVQGQPGRFTAPMPAPTPASMPPAAAGPLVAAGGQAPLLGGAAAAGSPLAPDRGNWFDRAWDNLLTTAENNPVSAAMQATQVGGMLVGLFQQSSASIARDAMARLDPNSPNGAEFRRLFEENAKREIENQYQTTRSGLEAKFAARGMLRSTVYTNAVESLDRARTELALGVPLKGLQAWNEVVRNSSSAMTAGANLARYASPQMDFSNMTRVLAQSPFSQQLAANASQQSA